MSVRSQGQVEVEGLHSARNRRHARRARRPQCITSRVLYGRPNALTSSNCVPSYDQKLEEDPDALDRSHCRWCRPYDTSLRIEPQTVAWCQLRHKYAVTQMPSVVYGRVTTGYSTWMMIQFRYCLCIRTNASISSAESMHEAGVS